VIKRANSDSVFENRNLTFACYITLKNHKGLKLNFRLAIFASGTGSNAQAIINYFKEHKYIDVDLIISNRKSAGVLDIAQNEGIDSTYISKSEFKESDIVLKKLENIDYIILAGFLLKIPDYLIKHFQKKIINIHPALLPKFGGKGMYGIHVHNAVKEASEKETGITIHLVDEVYDNGEQIAQFSIALNGEESAEEIAKKVLELEHKHFPSTIEKFIKN